MNHANQYNNAVNMYLQVLHGLDDEALYNMGLNNPIVYNMIRNDNVLRGRYDRYRAWYLRAPGRRY